MQPIEQACFWLARRAPRDPTPLSGSRDADVAIVGAGLTGLWTAYYLKRSQPDLRVVMLEAEIAGFLGGLRPVLFDRVRSG